MRPSIVDKLLAWGCIVLVFSVLLIAGLVQPYMEAQTFNRCTGGNISTWDALWADFRILDCKPPVEIKR